MRRSVLPRSLVAALIGLGAVLGAFVLSTGVASARPDAGGYALGVAGNHGVADNEGVAGNHGGVAAGPAASWHASDRQSNKPVGSGVKPTKAAPTSAGPAKPAPTMAAPIPRSPSKSAPRVAVPAPRPAAVARPAAGEPVHSTRAASNSGPASESYLTAANHQPLGASPSVPRDPPTPAATVGELSAAPLKAPSPIPEGNSPTPQANAPTGTAPSPSQHSNDQRFAANRGSASPVGASTGILIAIMLVFVFGVLSVVVTAGHRGRRAR